MTNNLSMKWCCIAWFCLAQFVMVAGASAQNFDAEPPVIEHDVVESAAADDVQSFSANVADDVELNSVRFLYRFEGDSQYTSIDMSRVASSSTYTAQVETVLDDPRAIQYYFEARDGSGNRTLRGYNFSPLVRLIEVPQLAQVPVVDEGPKGFNRRPLYYVVGGLVAAALVGALISGGSSGGGGSNPDGEVDFTLTVNAPGQ